MISESKHTSSKSHQITKDSKIRKDKVSTKQSGNN